MAVLEVTDLAVKVESYAVIVCWCLFALTFWLRKRLPKVVVAKRDWISLTGMFLQGAAYLFVWLNPLRQKTISPTHSGSRALEWALAVLTVAIALASVWLVNSAARRLGKQWALAARLVEGHELIQDGPYRFVRNPIYTGMFGMLVATGLAAGRWFNLLIAIVMFAVGTYIRIRSEERLLRQAFGSKFEVYARDVPALIPGIY
jgi:protein-S-isoprenylcysteine O-methyltransferase Ste14